MGDLVRPFDITETAFRVRTERPGPRFNVSGRHVVERHSAKTVSVIQIEHAELGSADACRALQHGFEYRFEVSRRGGNDLQDIGRRSLPLERLTQIIGALAQLVKQARVLDGDDGLRGEVLDQLDLLLAERAYLLAVDADHADQFVVLEHRDDEESANSGLFNPRDHERITIGIGFQLPDVVDVRGLFRADDSRKTGPGSRSNGAALKKRFESRRRVDV